MGAEQAQGTCLAFTDDDCLPHSAWLRALGRFLTARPEAAVGGRTVNALTDNPYSTAAQMLLDFLYAYYFHGERRNPPFLASSNLAVYREPFLEVGGFDTTFPTAAGEDREFCGRWIEHGYELVYAEEAVVYHAHALSLGSFLRRNFEYGRGGFLFHRLRSGRVGRGVQPEPLSFYARLVSQPFSDSTRSAEAFRLAALLLLSQAANASGFVFEAARTKGQAPAMMPIEDTKPTPRPSEIVPRGPRAYGLLSRSRHRVRIEPGPGWAAGLRDIWRHRELLYFLVWRDLKVRYRQSLFGVGWAVAQPLVLMLVFWAFVSKVIQVPSQGVPYPVFAFAALLPWSLFAQSMTSTSQSLVKNVSLISKVYVPRLAIPLASSASFLLDYLIALGLLLAGMAGIYGMYPRPAAALAVPGLTILAFALAASVGTALAAANVIYRDVQILVPLLAQVWLFASPVAYPSTLVPEPWRTVYGLNPMVGVVEGFRWALAGAPPPSLSVVLASLASTLVLLAGALAYFRRLDRLFADLI